MAPVVRIDAIKYARHERTAVSNFARPVDDHDLPMPLDYFVWAIHREGHPPLIVDTGFGEAAATARGRVITRPVLEGLRDAGIDHLSVEDVILTHLHYDHAGSPSNGARTSRSQTWRPVANAISASCTWNRALGNVPSEPAWS